MADRAVIAISLPKGTFNFAEMLELSRHKFGPRWKFIKFEIIPIIEDQQVITNVTAQVAGSRLAKLIGDSP